MSSHARMRNALVYALIVQVVLWLVAPTAASAAGREPAAPLALEPSPVEPLALSLPSLLGAADGPAFVAPEGFAAPVDGNPGAAIRAQAAQTTTLEVSVISSPWATLDNNLGQIADGPRVFVVEAVVTNTGDYTATDVQVLLDYNEDLANQWTLLGEEVDFRETGDISPLGGTYYAYWFATYTTTWNITHTYTVSAWAGNAITVATSSNAYENPGGATVQTRSTASTGNSGVDRTTSEIIVGSTFTMSVDYDLSTDPERLAFSPVGNLDFDPRAYRLVGSQVVLYDVAETQFITITDRLYIDPVPQLPDTTLPRRATVIYIFLARSPTSTRLCTYTAVSKGTTHKYDQFYCDVARNTVVPITATLTLSVTKNADRLQVEQGQEIDYTIQITNTGDRTLAFGWIWDELARNLGLITAYSPGEDAAETDLDQGRVAWYVGEINPGYTRTFTLTAYVDGNGLPLADQTAIVNQAFYGINEGSLPDPPAAYTSTVTTTLLAPTISLTKTDGLESIRPEEMLTYTVRIANSGAISATDVVITDQLPGEVTSPQGGVITWTLDSIAPGESYVYTVPATVNVDAGNRTVLTNTATATYQNLAGWNYVREATDETTVYSRGFIDGYAFVDADGSGTFDGGEVGLAGITVTLGGGLSYVDTLSLVTGADGYYIFEVDVREPVTVSASAAPAGYFRTTAGTVYTNAALWVTQTIPFGYAPVTSTFGVVYGTVYEDANHNGVRDGETGLAGVTVSSDAATPTSATTNGLGEYTLHFPVSGTLATITETNPPFYVSTTPDVVQRTVITGSDNESPLDFGDYLGIKVTGQVFSDTNVNGQNDDGVGIAGVPIALAQGGAALASTTTDSTGVYTIYTVPADSSPITVTETDLSGYLSTNAIGGAGTVKLDNNTLRISSPLSGTVYGGEFGDVLARDAITISGQVFEDLDADGFLDVGVDPGLGGAVISLSSGMTQTTGADGLFLLYGPPGSAITMTESNPTGYASTNAIPGNDATKYDNDTLIVAPLAGGSSSEGNLFADALTSGVAVISGTVFDDLSLDGTLDVGEPGLAGVEVTLEINGVITPVVVHTSPDGGYEFAVAPGQDVRVTSSGPGGAYYPTTPESRFLTPPIAGTYPGVDFGYSDETGAAAITGIVFDDLDGNGAQDFGEPGLAGAVITLTTSGGGFLDVVTTSGNGVVSGTFTFQITQTGSYVVSEEDPAGYHSTTPNQVAVIVGALGQTYEVAFGDSDDEAVSFFGTVFDDQNANTVWDWADEPSLPGVTVTLSSAGGSSAMATNGLGQYTFYITRTGTYTVVESDPDGYVSTIAIPGDAAVSYVDNNTLSAAVTAGMLAGTDLGDNLFGDVLASEVITVSGAVWNDNGDGAGIAGNGLWETGEEPGLAGATVSLSSGMAQATGADGAYTLYAPAGQVITLTETNPTVDYVSTAAIPGNNAQRMDDDTIQIEALAGGSTSADNLFGDVVPADLSVQKSDDPAQVVAGAVLTYTVDLANGGPAPAPDVWVTDTLSADVTFGGVVSWPAGSASPVYGAGALTWYTPTLAAGVSDSIVFTVTVNPDAEVIITNSAAIGGNVLDTDTADNDDDEQTRVVPTLSYSSVTYSAGEGDGTATITVELSAPSDQQVTVVYAASDGTATAGADYVSAGGVLTYAPGVTSQTFDVTILDDVLDEPDETVSLALSGATNAAILVGGSTLTIVDDEELSVDFDSTAYSVGESDGTATITVTLNTTSTWQTVTVDYDTADDTATAGADYIAASGTLTYTPGVTSQTFVVGILDDGFDEPNEVVDLTLSGVTNATVPDGTATLTIVDDEELTVSYSSTAYSVNENDPAGAATITVTLNTTSTWQTVTVDYDTSDGTANAPADYTDVSGTLTFVPGERVQTFSVPIVDDSSREYDETVDLALSNASAGLTIDGGTATLTILDNESSRVQFSAAAYSVDEDAGTATITVTLNTDSALQITVVYATSDGTATAGADYVSANGVLTFAPGVTSQSFQVTILNDGFDEPDETITLTLSNATEANIGANNPVALTIVDDEELSVEFDSTAYSVDEDAGTATITATLNTTSTWKTVTVGYATSDGTATVGADYLAASGVLTFAPGVDSQTFSVDIVNDGVDEPEETVVLTLSAPAEASLGAVNPATLTIVDEDELTVGYSSATYSVDEDGGSATITVVLNTSSTWQTATVAYATSDGTATAGADYVSASGVLTFAPGVTSQTFAVGILDDALYELTETVELALSGATVATISSGQATLEIVDNAANYATIYGYVYNDANGNGQMDGGEVGIAGVSVSISKGAIAHTATTDANGYYEWGHESLGMWVVTEQDLAGYFSTTPNEVHVTTAALGERYAVYFGDALREGAKFASVYGTVFEDEDNSQAWDADERGLSGVTVTLDGSATATTDQYGSYTLRVDTAGDHAVVETDPPGYLSSTPNKVDVTAALGNGYEVNYGDVWSQSCTCGKDAYEEDDSVAQAQELGDGERQQHNFCDDDEDWLQVTVGMKDTIKVTTSSWGQRADTFLALYGADQTTLLATSDDFQGTDDFSSEVVWQAPIAGVYYLRVTNRAKLDGCLTYYDIWLDRQEYTTTELLMPIVMRGFGGASSAGMSPAGVIDHPAGCSDSYETDDTWEQAGPIEDGVGQERCFDSDPLIWAADKDYVWFEIEAERTITFSVTPENAALSTVIELYDKNGVPMNVTRAGDNVNRLVFESVTGGRFILSVAPQNEAEPHGCLGEGEADYTLLAEKEPRFYIRIPIILRSYPK